MKKTGLAKRMREWMRAQKEIFTWQELLICVDIPGGPEKKTIYAALNDFIKRGEVIDVGAHCDAPQGKTHQYKYNRAYKPHGQDGTKKKILKAIYISNSRFTASDIQRLSGSKSIEWITEIITNLKRTGYIQIISRRKNGKGTANVYAVVSRDRFRVEIL